MIRRLAPTRFKISRFAFLGIVANGGQRSPLSSKSGHESLLETREGENARGSKDATLARNILAMACIA